MNRRLSDADVAALRTYLGEADDLKPWLSTEILGYLLSGENETLLLRLPKLAGLAPSFTRMLPLPQPDGPYGDPLTLARNTLRDEARVRFLYGCESWDAAVFRRLGQVFVALDSRSTALSSARPPTQFSPAWFRALLEAFKSCRPAGRWPTRPVGVLDAERCLELLKLDAVGADAFIDVWFASQDSWGWNSSNIKVLPGLSGVLADAVEAMITGVRRLPPAAQVGALDWIAKEIGMTNPALMGEVIKLLRGNKQVAAAALAALRGADRMRLRASAEALLAAKDTQDRLIAVQLLGRIIGSEAEGTLRTRLETETVRPVGQALREALLALAATDTNATEQRVDDETGYWSADGNWIAVPPFTLPPETPFPDIFPAALQLAVIGADRLRREVRATWGHTKDEGFDPVGLHLIAWAADGKTHPEENAASLAAARTMVHTHSSIYDVANKVFDRALTAFLARPDVTPWHLTRLAVVKFGVNGLFGHGGSECSSLLGDNICPAAKRLQSLIRQGLDMRAVLTMAQPWAGDGLDAAEWIIWRPGDYDDQFELRYEGLNQALWPLMAQHLAALDPYFGLAAWRSSHRRGDDDTLKALNILSLLPELPHRFLPGVLDAAMAGHPKAAPAARTLLHRVEAATPMLIGRLTSPNAAHRLRAAVLLAKMGTASDIAALRAALEKEKAEPVRAALLRALTTLGDDISDQFSEEKLLTQAKAGLAKTATKLSAWFPMDALPPLKWQDGRPVPAELVRWWLVLTDKTKLPGGDPLMRMTLDRLDSTGAAKLGTLVLSAFIARDTRRHSAEDAAAYAHTHAAGRLAMIHQSIKDFTLEQAFDQLRREKLAEYLTSANDHRGILALARHAPGADAAQMVRAYFRDHYPRTAQCKALQLVLATANRYRTAAVQTRASELVDEIATENGWGRDELADRTMPTGGLDANGVLDLPIGDRVFRVQLDTAGKDFAVTLTNPAGKPIKALPTLPQGALASEHEDLAAAKKALASLRKEIKQTAEIQTARLYEAMCAARVWPPEEFGTYLLRHPIVGPLCRRLVFAGLDAGGQVVGSFRPIGDGTLTDCADVSVSLDGFARIRVAHSALVPEDTAKRWRTHLANYKVTPLFDQFDRPVPDLTALRDDAIEIEDRKGWMIETFKLRAAATKLGYQRGQAEEHNIFTSYDKPFASLRLVVRIEFTGAAMPESNLQAALTSLSVFRHGGGIAQRLRDLPPVLLIEVWKDLYKIAAAGTGFDEDWESKAEWS